MLPDTAPSPPWIHSDSIWDPSRSVWAHPDSPNIRHQKVSPLATFSPWLSDQDFLDCYSKACHNTVVDVFRCYELWSIAKQLKEVPGCFLEVGAWQGGSGAVIAAASELISPERDVYLADTFEGVVKAGPNDTKFQGGEYSNTSIEIVTGLLHSLKLNNFHILKGIFPEQTSHNIDQPIALLHCDVDVYQSAKDITEWVLPRLSLGGTLVFDDYGFSGCEGITRYAHELSQRSDLLFLHNLNGHAIFVKR